MTPDTEVFQYPIPTGTERTGSDGRRYFWYEGRWHPIKPQLDRIEELLDLWRHLKPINSCRNRGEAMSKFKRYRRLGYVEARPYVPGENINEVSISTDDSYSPLEGGWIARNPGNYKDQWYISGKYFLEYFDQTPVDGGEHG